MNCKKIVIINGSICGGGAERFTVNFANTLVKDSNYKILLITAKKKLNEYVLHDDVNRYCILSEKFLKDVFCIRHFLIKNEIDTAVAIGIYANLVLCAGNFFLKTRIIISERNDPKHDSLSKTSKLLRKLFYWRSDKYVFQTKGAQSFYSKSIQNRSVIIHNPIKDNLPYKNNIYNKEIVAVGRLMPQKNYPLLLKAFKHVSDFYPEYKLRIFGQGILLNELKSLAEQIKISDKVDFEGFCSNVHEAIKKSDIFVMSSDFEGMPNSLMEAMAMGFPVISTDCPAGGPAELIKNGVNGILVPVRNEEALAKAIINLIDNSKLKRKLAKNALDIRKSHSAETIINIWKGIL